MGEAAKLLQILVAIWVVECFAIIVICLLLVLLPPRDSHSVARIPDFVPDEWGPTPCGMVVQGLYPHQYMDHDGRRHYGDGRCFDISTGMPQEVTPN